MPSYIETELAPGIKHYRFHRVPGWEAEHPAGTPQHNVLAAMRDNGAYSLVEVKSARTAAIGPREGVANPTAFVRGVEGPAVVVNAGFFVHYPYLYREHEGGMPLGRRFYQSPVGETRTTDSTGVTTTFASGSYVPVSPAYGELIVRRDMDDQSYFTVGPSLHEALPIAENVAPERINRFPGRFSYFATKGQEEETNLKFELLDRARRFSDSAATEFTWNQKKIQEWRLQAAEWNGTGYNKIVSQRWSVLEEVDKGLEQASGTGASLISELETLTEYGRARLQQDGRIVARAADTPENRYMKGLWAQVPGTLSHVREPNERSGASIHRSGSNKTVLFHAYTSKRSDGLPMNDFRNAMAAGMEFVGQSIDTTEPNDVWANDGGPSIFHGFLDERGNMSLLAQGGMNEQVWPLEMRPASMRPVPNAMVAKPHFDNVP